MQTLVDVVSDWSNSAAISLQGYHHVFLCHKGRQRERERRFFHQPKSRQATRDRMCVNLSQLGVNQPKIGLGLFPWLPYPTKPMLSVWEQPSPPAPYLAGSMLVEGGTICISHHIIYIYIILYKHIHIHIITLYTLHYITLYDMTWHFITYINYITLHDMTWRDMTLHIYIYYIILLYIYNSYIILYK